MTLDWCKGADVGLPRPDLVIYMTVPEEVIALREGFGDEIYESLDFQAKVKHNFSKLIEDNWKVISADEDMERMHQKLLTIVKATMVDSYKPLQLLWTK